MGYLTERTTNEPAPTMPLTTPHSPTHAARGRRDRRAFGLLASRRFEIPGADNGARALRFTPPVLPALLLLFGMFFGAATLKAEVGTVNLPALNPSLTVQVVEYCPEEKFDFFRETLLKAIDITDGIPVRFERINTKTLREEKVPSADILFADPSVAAGLYRFAGWRPVLSLLPAGATSPNEAAAAAILVPKGSPVLTLRDLTGKSILANDRFEIPVTTYLAADLRWQGLDPEGVISGVADVSETTLDTARRLLRGEADAILLPACRAQALPDDIRSELRVVEPRRYDALACPHSTQPGPEWMILTSTRATKEQIEWLKEHFLAIAPSAPDGTEPAYRWVTYDEPERLLEIMFAGPDTFFERFRHYSWQDLLRQNPGAVLAVVVILLTLLAWSIFTTLRLGRRTTEYLNAQERLGNLERISIVGQMSAMIAHELRQPLFAIRNYAGSLRRRRERGTLTDEAFEWGLKRIVEESTRANDIIEHVRSYAKPGPEARRPVENLSVACWRGFEEQRSKIPFDGRFSAVITPQIFAPFDTLEIVLILRTLMKNAAEALSGVENAEVRVRLYEENPYSSSSLVKPLRTSDAALETRVVIEVSDNGRGMTDARLAELGYPLHSSKPHGLGLGLSIVRRIVERAGGSIEFRLNPPAGLTVRVLFPKEPPHGDSA